MTSHAHAHAYAELVRATIVAVDSLPHPGQGTGQEQTLVGARTAATLAAAYQLADYVWSTTRDRDAATLLSRIARRPGQLPEPVLEGLLGHRDVLASAQTWRRPEVPPERVVAMVEKHLRDKDGSALLLAAALHHDTLPDRLRNKIAARDDYAISEALLGTWRTAPVDPLLAALRQLNRDRVLPFEAALTRDEIAPIVAGDHSWDLTDRLVAARNRNVTTALVTETISETLNASQSGHRLARLVDTLVTHRPDLSADQLRVIAAVRFALPGIEVPDWAMRFDPTPASQTLAGLLSEHSRPSSILACWQRLDDTEKREYAGEVLLDRWINEDVAAQVIADVNPTGSELATAFEQHHDPNRHPIHPWMGCYPEVMLAILIARGPDDVPGYPTDYYPHQSGHSATSDAPLDSTVDPADARAVDAAATGASSAGHLIGGGGPAAAPDPAGEVAGRFAQLVADSIAADPDFWEASTWPQLSDRFGFSRDAIASLPLPYLLTGMQDRALSVEQHDLACEVLVDLLLTSGGLATSGADWVDTLGHLLTSQPRVSARRVGSAVAAALA